MKRFIKCTYTFLLFTLFALLSVTAFSYSFIEDIDIDSYDLALIPYGHGREVSTDVYRKMRYPSRTQSMQFMMFYNSSSTTGYYIQTKDSTGYIADWEIRKINNVKHLRITFYGPTKPNIVKQTITIDPAKPYIAAAEKYKTWAFQQSWAKRKISKTDSVKICALAASPYFTWLGNTYLPPYLSKFEEADTDINNPATSIWFTLWRSDSFDTNYPRYTPATYGGSFSNLLSSLHDRGSIPMPYINGCLWDINMTDPDGYSSHVYDEGNMIKDSSGNLVYYQVGSDLAYACPSIGVWKELMRQARQYKILDSSNTISAGVYYDMVASAEPVLCYNSNHSHGNGNPLIWQLSYHWLLEQTEGVVMVEGFAEVYIDVVDVYLMHSNTDGADRVPLWNAVYGTISRSSGWYVDASSQTAANTMATLKEAKSFGSRTWGSPWMATNGNALDYQSNILTTGYEDIISMISAAPTVLEDGATGITKWYNSGNISNVYDSLYGKNVIQKTGTGVETTTPSWTHTGTNARWSVKRSNPDDMITGFKVSTVSGKTVYLYYTDWPATVSPTIAGSNPYYIYHGIGIAPTNNAWQSIERDLEADMKDKLPNETIDKVQMFLMFNNPGSVCDIKLFPRLP
jgi:Domain of unknown function (DUF6259)